MKEWPEFSTWREAYRHLRLNRVRDTPPACYVHGARVSLIDGRLCYSTRDSTRKNIAECLRFTKQHLNIARRSLSNASQFRHKRKARYFLRTIHGYYQPRLRRLP